MDTITIIDTFHYPPRAPEVFMKLINRMKELALEISSRVYAFGLTRPIL